MKVVVSNQNTFAVKLNQEQKIKISTISGGVQVPAEFGDLSDFDATGVGDKYIIMYDAATQTYKAVNPDELLTAAATGETTQPGLPGDFINALDTDLNRTDNIDIDAGTF